MYKVNVPLGVVFSTAWTVDVSFDVSDLVRSALFPLLLTISNWSEFSENRDVAFAMTHIVITNTIKCLKHIMLQWTSNFQKRNKPKMFYFTLKNSVDQRSMNEKSPALPTKK